MKFYLGVVFFCIWTRVHDNSKKDGDRPASHKNLYWNSYNILSIRNAAYTVTGMSLTPEITHIAYVNEITYFKTV